MVTKLQAIFLAELQRMLQLLKF